MVDPFPWSAGSISTQIHAALANYFKTGELESFGLTPQPIFRDEDFEPLVRSLSYEDRDAAAILDEIERHFFVPDVPFQKVSEDLSPENRRTARALINLAIERNLIRRVKIGSIVRMSLTANGVALATKLIGHEPKRSFRLERRILQPDVLSEVCAEFNRWKAEREKRLERRKEWARKKHKKIPKPKKTEQGSFSHAKISVHKASFSGLQILTGLLDKKRARPDDLKRAYNALRLIASKEMPAAA